MGKTTEVLYRVPVYVTVDLDEGRVTDVQIDDEAPTLDRDNDPDAVEIAENNNWPAWEFCH